MDEEHLKVLSELRDELREQRKLHERKRWFEKDPFKGMITHAATLLVAICAGYGLHMCTGQPVTIEASNSKPKSDEIASPAATAEATASIEVTEAPSASVVAEVPKVTRTTTTTKTKTVTVVAVASASPQVFHAAAPKAEAPTAVAPVFNAEEPAEPSAAPVRGPKE